MTDPTIHLGYEVGTGEPVAIPIRHMAVTGQTQESGKTTTLEALISRSELRAVAFITKRAEGSFRGGRRIPPYFRERADWRFVSAVLEATLRERVKWERSWIMRACKGAGTLADVHDNVRALMAKAKGLSADVYLTLDEYLQVVVPQVTRLPYTDKLSLAPGLNIMDLGAYTSELQALVIRSVLEWVYERERDTVVIIPEAWEFIPQRRGSPVLLAAEELIRKGAGLRNYMWLDSQDLAGVNVAIRKSVVVWLLGVQREENEVKRTLAYIPNVPKPKVDDVMRLGKGQFFACWGSEVRRVYVQPEWMDEKDAQAIARGETTVTGVEFYRDLNTALIRAKSDSGLSYEALAEAVKQLEEDEMSAAERAQYEQTIADQGQRIGGLLGERDEDAKVIEELQRQLRQMGDRNAAGEALQLALRNFLGTVPAVSVDKATMLATTVDVERIVGEVLRRLPTGTAVIQVTPPEALRKEFQQREVARILEAVRAFTVTQRDVVAMMEGNGSYATQSTIAARLGKGMGGWLAGHLKPLQEQRFILVDGKRGVKGNLRGKIAEDLVFYQASDEDVEQVYQHCLAALAAPEEG